MHTKRQRPMGQFAAGLLLSAEYMGIVVVQRVCGLTPIFNRHQTAPRCPKLLGPALTTQEVLPTILHTRYRGRTSPSFRPRQLSWPCRSEPVPLNSSGLSLYAASLPLPSRDAAIEPRPTHSPSRQQLRQQLHSLLIVPGSLQERHAFPHGRGQDPARLQLQQELWHHATAVAVTFERGAVE